jgi:hypothetical protein
MANNETSATKIKQQETHREEEVKSSWRCKHEKQRFPEKIWENFMGKVAFMLPLWKVSMIYISEKPMKVILRAVE